MNRSARLREKVNHLIQLAQRISTAPSDKVEFLCQQILARTQHQEDYLTQASCLNNDGVPLQLCLSSSIGGTSLRLIGDPGAHLADLELRYQIMQASLHRCIDLSQSASLSELAMQTLRQFIPESVNERSHYHQGFAWLALSPEQSGFAFYLETAPLGRAAGWDAVQAWLAQVLPSDQTAQQIVAKLSQHCVVASVGLEGRDVQHCRAKIYFRLAQSMPLAELGIDLLVQAPMMEFLSLTMGEFGVDREGLVMSAGFSVSTGALMDVKLDLCGHCLTYQNHEWLKVIDQLVQHFGLTPFSLEDILLHKACQVAFIGLGLDAHLQPRLNVYLKAAERQGIPSGAEIQAAIVDGVNYLCQIQQDDGRWVDYQLPVGAADQWVTAYVGFALAQYGLQHHCPVALSAARRAAAWLCESRSYPVGWGYNALTGPDADSTALVLALLRELGWTIQPKDQAFLKHQWRSEGGLATYEGPRAWGTVHWDVTPWGYLGLSMADQQQLRQSFLQGLVANRMEGSMWRSYWWRNPYYSTLLTLEVLQVLELPEPDLPYSAPKQAITVDNAFDLSCLIGIEVLRLTPLERLGGIVRSLLAWQDIDGRWNGHPNLRVTDDTCFAPWDEPKGTYYTDHAGTITTATVLRVLTRVLSAQLGAKNAQDCFSQSPA